MADDRYDYYSNSPENRSGRDRDRDVYLDNRTGVGAEGRGYRAEYDRDRGYGGERDRSDAERHYGDRDYFRNQSGGSRESRSFSPDRDYGVNRGYRTYGGADGYRSQGRSDNGDRGDGARNSAPASNRGFGFGQDLSGGAYNPYPSYAYGGNEVPYQYEGEPNRPQTHRNERGGRDFWDRTGDTIASWFGNDEARRRHEVDMRTQDHQGKGPKAYKRSDARIQEDVNDRLTDDAWLDATHIDVLAQDTEVTLTGTVNSRDDRRHAERIAESVSGVTHVQNNLRVDTKQPNSAPVVTGEGEGGGVNSTLDKQAQGGRH